MIKPYVITLDQVKTYLGISDTTYDTQIALYIPDVTDDLTRAQGICNQDFLATGTADTAGTITLSNVNISIWDDLYIGSLIYINGEDGEISDFDEDAQTITLTAALTKTATSQDLYIRNFPRGAKQTVAKMVMFRVDSTNTTAEGHKETQSETVGPVNVSYADSSGDVSLDRFGYPESLTKALRTIRRMRFV